MLHIVCPSCGTMNRVSAARRAKDGKCGRCHAPLFEGRPLTLTEAAFEAHANRGDLPLLVDFWAPWCGPCQAMAPDFEEAAARLEPRVRLGKVDTEQEPALAARFGIRSIPTLILFHGGREIARSTGAMPLGTLLTWVEQQLAGTPHHPELGTGNRGPGA